MPRKPRPLLRDKQQYRDDRLLIIACDDRYAPKQCFDAFEFKRVQIHVEATLDCNSSANHVLDRLLAISCDPDDERWLILDVDHYSESAHIATLRKALQRARQANVNVAMSKPCFEAWLLLHHAEAEVLKPLASASEVLRTLRSLLESYSKIALNPADFKLDSVADAYRRAKILDGEKAEGDIPTVNTSRVYRIWDSIFSISGPCDLPLSLKPLAEQLGYHVAHEI